MRLELSVSCDQIEDMVQTQHNLDMPVKLIKMDYDSIGDLCAFEFEVDDEQYRMINRNWDDYAFTEGLVEEAI